MARIKFGDLFLKAKLIDELQLKAALAHQKGWGGRLGDALIELGFVDEEMVYKALSHQLKLPLVSLQAVLVNSQLLAGVSLELAERHAIFPVERTSQRLTVATADPSDDEGIREVSFAAGVPVGTVIAPAREIHWAIGHHYRGENVPMPPPRKRAAQSEERFEIVGRGGVTFTPSTVAPPAVPPRPQPAAPGPRPLYGLGAPVQYGNKPAPPAPHQLEAMVGHNDRFLEHLIETCIQRGVFTRGEFEERLRNLPATVD